MSVLLAKYLENTDEMPQTTKMYVVKYQSCYSVIAYNMFPQQILDSVNLWIAWKCKNM